MKVAHHGSKASTTADFLAAGEIPLYTTQRRGGINLRFLGNGAYEVETFKAGE